MVFKCQEDSFLKEYESKVISCEKAKLKTVENGSKKTIEGYEVICEDTVLFPEGGGQPSDYGFMNNTKVLQVSRRGTQAVHFVTESFDIGENVKQIVDWVRREDHMQQHSGQHLISALFENDYGYDTFAWWLGEDVSYVELNVSSLTNEQISDVEQKCNSLIRAATKVNVKIIKEGESDPTAKTRGLPVDHKGDIRVINIEGIDNNMCCGTHVSNLSQLQAIKLLYSEKGKRKDKTVLYFLVGNRILKQLGTCLDREQKMTALLNNNPIKHVELVDKLQKNLKITTKNLQSVLKDIVMYEVEKLKTVDPKPKYYALHRKEAEPDFLLMFIREINSTDILLFLTIGDEKMSGNMVLYGPEKPVADLGTKICELLNGKGAGKGNKFQAKINNMSNRGKCIELIENYYLN